MTRDQRYCLRKEREKRERNKVRKERGKEKLMNKRNYGG